MNRKPRIALLGECFAAMAGNKRAAIVVQHPRAIILREAAPQFFFG